MSHPSPLPSTRKLDMVMTVINSNNNSISSHQLLMEVISSNSSSNPRSTRVEAMLHHLSNSNSKGSHLRERANNSKDSLLSPHSRSFKVSNLSLNSSSNSRLSRVSLNNRNPVEASKVSRHLRPRPTRPRSSPSTSNSKLSTVPAVRHLRTTSRGTVAAASATPHPCSRHRLMPTRPSSVAQAPSIIDD